MRAQKSRLFFGSFLIPFLILACEGKVPSNQLGPATSSRAIERAQIDSLSKLNALETNSGQLVHIAETQEITTSDGPIYGLLKEWTTKVTQRIDFKPYIELTTIKKVLNHNIEGKPIFEFKSVLTIDKNDLKSHQAFKPETLAKKLSQKKYQGLQTKNSEPKITDVSFHNLSVQNVVLTPPELVVNSPDCRGLSSCQINADRIAYDIVFHFSDDSTRSHQIEWLISSEVPFFSSILKQCATTLVPVDDVRVLVKQCQEVVDFSF